MTAEPSTLQGKKGLRVMMSEAAQRQLDSTGNKLLNPSVGIEELAVIEGVEFGNGAIEAEIAGSPKVGAPTDARGFVGIAFRVQKDLRTYDAFYLRPTNGRADDQLRRNHSAQYISHPDWPFYRFRMENPGQYESYVDLVPNQWTKIKIEVNGSQARLYVHDQVQPTLIVHDLKTGANAQGGIALWIDPGTLAYFRHLTVNRRSTTVGK